MNVARFALAMAVLLALASAAPAQDKSPAASSRPAASSEQPIDLTQKPAEIIDQTVKRVLGYLDDPQYKNGSNRKELREKIRALLVSVADMDRIGVLSLANFRDKFTDEQFHQFLDDFANLLFSTYISNIEKYSGEEVEVLETVPVADDRVTVKTTVTSDEKDIPIDYNLIEQDGQWRCYDVFIEGVSLVKNYRSQFRDILANKSAADFLDRIEKKVKENEKSL